MTLDAGQLSFATERGEVFRAPVEAVEARFSAFSTLTVRVAGATHHFVTGAYAGAFAPPFSERQLAELSDGAGQEALELFGSGAVTVVTANVVGGLAALAGSVLGRVAGIAGNAVGVVHLFRSQAQSFSLAKAWADFLRVNGVRVRMRGTTFARSQWLVAAIVVPCVAAVAVIVMALQSIA